MSSPSPPDPRAPPEAPATAARAAALVIFAGVLFATMNAIIRHLSGELPPLEIVFFRNFFGLVAMLPWLVRHGPRALRTRRAPLIALRAGMGFVSMAAWFSALAIVPLGAAVALSFTAPLFTALAAVLVLGEVIRARRITALAVGFAGMLIILRPGFTAVGIGEALVLFSAATMALSIVIMKVLTRTEAAESLVTYQTLLITPISLVPALLVWTWPSASGWLWGIALGVLASTAHVAFTRAFALAETTYLMPFDYLRLPVVAIIGWVAFGERTDAYTWVGAAVIAASTIYVAHREARARRRERVGGVEAGGGETGGAEAGGATQAKTEGR